jgi:hypothetical protein
VDSTIQEMTALATSVMSYGTNLWSVGTLGALKIKTSNDMFLRVCVPWTKSGNNGETAADLYLYYSSTEGGIKKLGWRDGQWQALTDPPQINSRGFIECQNDLGGWEKMWIVNNQHELEQWAHNPMTNSSWAVGKQKLSLPNTPKLWTLLIYYSFL